MNKTLRATLVLLCVLTVPFLLKADSGAELQPSDPKPVYYNLFKDIYFVNLIDGGSDINEKLVSAAYESYLVQTNPIIKISFYGLNLKDAEILGQFESLKIQLIARGVAVSDIIMKDKKNIDVASPYFTIIVEEASLLNQ